MRRMVWIVAERLNRSWRPVDDNELGVMESRSPRRRLAAIGRSADGKRADKILAWRTSLMKEAVQSVTEVAAMTDYMTRWPSILTRATLETLHVDAKCASSITIRATTAASRRASTSLPHYWYRYRYIFSRATLITDNRLMAQYLYIV